MPTQSSSHFIYRHNGNIYITFNTAPGWRIVNHIYLVTLVSVVPLLWSFESVFCCLIRAFHLPFCYHWEVVITKIMVISYSSWLTHTVIWWLSHGYLILFMVISYSSWLISYSINFCIGRWHTVFSPVFDITTNSAPLTWASFPIINLFIFPIRYWVGGTFSSPLISIISPTFKTLFFECFSILFIWCCRCSFKYTDHSSPLIIH